MYFKIVLFGILLTTSIISITGFHTERIINGTVATYQVPWVARLITGNINGFIYSNCGGSLIHPQWVLTAKHCLINTENGSDSGVIKVSIGNNEYVKGQMIDISDKYFVQTTKYQVDYNDIALIKLKYPVSDITPVKMQLTDDLDYRGMSATIYGWGHTLEGNGLQQNESSVDILRTTSVILVDRLTCSTVNKICFDPKLTNTNACVGDSGGPMVYFKNNEPILIGVTSTVAANPLCSQNGLSVYMSVPYYITWIKQTTGIY